MVIWSKVSGKRQTDLLGSLLATTVQQQLGQETTHDGDDHGDDADESSR